MAENQYGFPTEVLSLPSQGLLYPEDSPLRSGTIDVKYMTAKEEDILTSTNLIEQGGVITRLLESVIADPKVKLNDMLVGDKNAIMVGTRILGYGKDYDITLTDPDTNERVEYSVDLSKLENKPIDEKLFEKGNNFTFELPNSKRIVGFKLLTQQDENEIRDVMQDYEKVQKLTGVSYALTTRFKHQIVSIDGEIRCGSRPCDAGVLSQAYARLRNVGAIARSAGDQTNSRSLRGCESTNAAASKDVSRAN